MKQWETEATRELSAIIYELSHNQYRSKVALANRLRAAAEAIELVAAPDIRATHIGKIRRNRHDQLHPLQRQTMHRLRQTSQDDHPS